MMIILKSIIQGCVIFIFFSVVACVVLVREDLVQNPCTAEVPDIKAWMNCFSIVLAMQLLRHAFSCLDRFMLKKIQDSKYLQMKY